MTAEQLVVGSLLVDTRIIDDVLSLVPIDAIQDGTLREIYTTCQNLHKKGSGVDIITVTKALGDRLEQIGGIGYLLDLTNKIGSTQNIESHCRIILDDHLRTKLIGIANTLQLEAMDKSKPATDAYLFATKMLNSIDAISSHNYSKLSQELLHTIQQIGEAKKHREETGLNYSGLDTGLPVLNKRLGGWEDGSLTIIAARPAMGKTALMLHCAASAKKPVLIFSLEMPKHQLAKRYLSSVSGIEYLRLRSGAITDNEFTQVVNNADTLMEYNIFIDDTGALNVDQIQGIAGQVKKKYGLSAIFIDYLQLLRADDKNRNREQEVGYISRTLKAIAKKLEIPVIALAQLNRANESRSDKRPMLSDLRDSGQMEQDADNIIFLHRPEYYDEHTDKDGNSTERLMELLTKKNRNGEIGIDKVHCNLQHNIFMEWQQTPATMQQKQPVNSNENLDDLF